MVGVVAHLPHKESKKISKSSHIICSRAYDIISSLIFNFKGETIMKRYAVYFTDYGCENGCVDEMDQRMRRDFETLDEACKFAVAINKKARYFDIEVFDTFEEEVEL